jgi:hypothetical protein
MKGLITFLALLFMISPALAGEDPYVAVIGNDLSANSFYFSPKYLQWAYDQTIFGVPTSGEYFLAKLPIIQPEVCDTNGTGTGPFGSLPPFQFRGLANSRVSQGNSGWYYWYIRLPKKPVGEINLVIQCGILKPDTFARYAFGAVNICAAETGERILEGGTCAHEFVPPGVNPIVPAALPRITAAAFPGPYNEFNPFYLTAYKNPGTYTIAFDPTSKALSNDSVTQVLDGSTSTRIMLKACMDKTIVVKIPVAGQLNQRNQQEADLVEGDVIGLLMNITDSNTVDIYCHEQSLRLMGIGEAPF